MVLSFKETDGAIPSESISPAGAGGLLRAAFSRTLLLAFLVLLLLSVLGPRIFSSWEYGPWVLTAIAIGLAGLVGAMFYKAGRILRACRQENARLIGQRNTLQEQVEIRTRDLTRSKEDLKRKGVAWRQAEAALQASEARFRLLIETIPNPVFFKDEAGVFLGCNAAYANTIGLPKEQIVGRRLVDLTGIAIHDMAEQYHRQDLAMIKNPGVQVHEEQTICADGATRDFMLFKATFCNDDGNVAGLVGVMLDITERIKIERALQESKNLFDAFMAHLPGLAFIKDLNGRYIFANRAFCRFVEMPPDGPLGHGDHEIWDADTAARLSDNDRLVQENLTAASVMETITMAGHRQRCLLITRFPIFQDAEMTALGGVAIDITDRTQAEQRQRRLERQLQQVQKMEALGTLAGGIAHDFNNILAAVIGYTQIALADLPKDAPVRSYLQRVLEAGERASALVKQILTFSRAGDTEPQPVQMRPIIKEVLKLMRASLPVTISFVQHLNSDATVMADPVQIHQVMMNLCANAGYAMREQGGTLTVTLEDATLDERSSSLQTGLIKPGPHVHLSVADTGSGIAPEDLGRIFDPFFTTKPQGEGTGMGLSVVHGIVSRLGGDIAVESAPGQGTRFDIHLPAVANAAKPVQRSAGSLPKGNERILLVDDEPFQTDMLKHTLDLLGYRVAASNSSSDALALFEADPHAFDLVITDLMMPELRGDDMAERMLALRGDLPIILCTGFGDNISVAKTEAIGIRAFVLKPMAMADLAHLIRKVLHSESDGVAE